MALVPSQRELSSAATAILVCVALTLSVTAPEFATGIFNDGSERELLSACAQVDVPVVRVRIGEAPRDWAPRSIGPLEPEPAEPGLRHRPAGRARWERGTAAISSQGPPAV